MKKRIVVLAGAVFGITLAVGAAAGDKTELLRETGNAFAEIAERALPAVVYIDAETTVEVPQYGYRYQPFRDFWGRRGQMAIPQELEPKKYSREGQGSGFIISKDGYILTNNHVVKDADRITVVLGDERKFSAKVIGSDPKTEVALIKIDDPHELPFLELGDSDRLRVGEWVLAAGNPFGLSQTLTAGIVSAKGRSELGLTEYGDFIQTDAAINPGNSGGPLLDIDGKVVGINTAIYSKSGGYMGIGFAIPIEQAIPIKNQLIETGTISRSVLGVYIQNVDQELAESFGLEEKGGILISQVVEDSAAEEGGLKEGDIIVELNGKKVGKLGAFRNQIAATPPNTTIDLKIFRNGKCKNISTTTNAMEGGAVVSDSGLQEKMGLSVENLDEETKHRFGRRGIDGVLITKVGQGTPAWRARLQPGQVIASVNRQPVEDVEGFMQMISEAGNGKILLLIVDGRSSRFVVLSLD